MLPRKVISMGKSVDGGVAEFGADYIGIRALFRRASSERVKKSAKSDHRKTIQELPVAAGNLAGTGRRVNLPMIALTKKRLAERKYVRTGLFI